MLIFSLFACGELGNLPDLDGDAQNVRDCARLDAAVYTDAAEIERDGAIRRLDRRFVYWQDGNWNY